MTEVTDVQDITTDETIRTAMQLIDQGLGDIAERQIVSTAEVADLLLDLRSVLVRLDARVSSN